MRQLKRSLTVVEPTGLGAESTDVSKEPAQRPFLPAVPQLPLSSRPCNAMDPPLQPPPWKRPARLCKSPPPLPTTPLRRSARSPPQTTPTPQSRQLSQSPQRLLTPRVSWSDIICHSQENIEDTSPQTPRATGRRPPSPPQRVPWRRRPPSYDEGGLTEDQNDGCMGGSRLLTASTSIKYCMQRGRLSKCCAPPSGRFSREFCGVAVIGKGQFSTVYRAQHRIDQCLYAVKKTTRISRGLRRTQLREVFALANVSMEEEGCPNIVRYYSSWVEDGRLHIQTELCECSLRENMAERRRKEPEDPSFAQSEIIKVLQQVGNGLKVLHSCGFAHLDIKPDNILVSRNQREQGRYKIADLGLAAAAMGSGCDDISEGDCRYLAKEVLQGNLSDLPKADVFSLGLLLYELATNPTPLPCNGEDWQRLREGHLELDALSHLSESLLTLLQSMVHRLPAHRPSCQEMARHPAVLPDDGPLAVEELMRQRTLAVEKNRQLTLEAERNRQLADTYWQEMMNLKRQELLYGNKAAAISKDELSEVMPPPLASALVRGKTF